MNNVWLLGLCGALWLLPSCQRDTIIFGQQPMACSAASLNGTMLAADWNHQGEIEVAVCRQAPPLAIANWQVQTLQSGVNMGNVAPGIACGMVAGQPCVVTWSDSGLRLNQLDPAQAAPWVSRSVVTDQVCFREPVVLDFNGQACVAGLWTSPTAPGSPFEFRLALLSPSGTQSATADSRLLFKLDLDQAYMLQPAALALADKLYVTYHDVESGGDMSYHCQVFTHQAGVWEQCGASTVGMAGKAVRSSNLAYHDGQLQLLLVDNELQQMSLFSASPAAAAGGVAWQEVKVSPDARQVALLALDSIGGDLYAGYVMNTDQNFVTGGFRLGNGALITRQGMIDHAALHSEWPLFMRLVNDGSRPYLVVNAADLHQGMFADAKLRVMGLN